MAEEETGEGEWFDKKLQEEIEGKYKMKDVCQCYKKVIVTYYWRVDMCEKCENKARKKGGIK